MLKSYFVSTYRSVNKALLMPLTNSYFLRVTDSK